MIHHVVREVDPAVATVAAEHVPPVGTTVPHTDICATRTNA